MSALGTRQIYLRLIGQLKSVCSLAKQDWGVGAMHADDESPAEAGPFAGAWTHDVKSARLFAPSTTLPGLNLSSEYSEVVNRVPIA